MTNFFRNKSGGVMVYAALSMPVIVGLFGFAIDAQTHYTSNTDLQHVADAAALAGAAELDGGANARSRATAKAQGLVTNTSVASNPTSPANGLPTSQYPNVAVPSGNITFLKGDLCDTAATSDADAACIKVITEQRTLVVRFMQIVGFSGSVISQGVAVAESRYVACAVTPMMVCQSNANNWNPAPGTQFRLKSNATAVNGAFGLLYPPGDNGGGATTAEKYLASPDPNFCFNNTLTVKNGNNAGPTDEGLNVRFDLYPNGNGGIKDVIKAYPPAPHVGKGSNQNCPASNNFNMNQMASRYPPDTSFTDDYLGTGIWKGPTAGSTTYIDAYIAKQHSTKTAAQKTFLQQSPTRYDLYLRELGIASDDVQVPKPNTLPNQLMPSGGSFEDVAPKCYAQNASMTSYDPRRRMIYVAIVDCTGMGNGSQAAPQAKVYGKFFLTQPSGIDFDGSTANGTVLAEFVKKIVPGGDDGKLHHIVQLVN